MVLWNVITLSGFYCTTLNTIHSVRVLVIWLILLSSSESNSNMQNNFFALRSEWTKVANNFLKIYLEMSPHNITWRATMNNEQKHNWEDSVWKKNKNFGDWKKNWQRKFIDEYNYQIFKDEVMEWNCWCFFSG